MGLAEKNLHILSLSTSWIDGKDCDECCEIFEQTVEFKIDELYYNMCSKCYSDLFKWLTNE